MKTKDQKVEELVERVARWLCKRDNKGRDCWVVESKDNQNIYKKEAKQVLNDPDLYLQVTGEKPIVTMDLGAGDEKYYSIYYLSLAEALKEASHPSYKSREMLDKLKEKE